MAPVSSRALAEWNEAHTGYTLSYASELRPPVDALAFSALLKAAARGDTAAITTWLDAGGSAATDSGGVHGI